MSDLKEELKEEQQTENEAETTGSAGDEPSAAKLQADLEKFRDLAMRSQADFDNFRKRAARERDEAIKFANASLLERLLPVFDNFELGLTAARQGTGNSSILQGMEMVFKQLQDFLSQSGIEPVAAEGELFDPNVHEAVSQEESDEVPEGHVLRQLRKGYKLRDRLLRAAMVVVSKGPSKR